MPTPVTKPSLKIWLFNHNSDYCTLRTPTPVVETPNLKKYATLDTLNALTPVVETGLKAFAQLLLLLKNSPIFNIIENEGLKMSL